MTSAPEPFRRQLQKKMKSTGRHQTQDNQKVDKRKIKSRVRYPDSGDYFCMITYVEYDTRPNDRPGVVVNCPSF